MGMSSSGTYNFSLSNGSILLEAWDRVGIRPAAITREMMSSGLRSLNLEMQSWNNMPVNLWKIELLTIPLVQGQATYSLDPSYMMITDAYCSLIQNGQPPIDRILVEISRDEYATYTSKTQQGAPTVFWLDRLESPTITLYLVPDGSSETNLMVYAMRRVQDANLGSAETPDITIRFLDALVAKVAQRLALKYNKEVYALLKSAADEAMLLAEQEDKQRSALRVTPDFSVWSI
jgi:hypothetical protein